MKNLMRLMFAVTTIFCLSVSVRAQHSWSTPVPIDTASIAPVWYQGGEMALDDSGNIYATYSTSRSESIYVARSTNGGNTWNKYTYASGAESLRTPKGIAVDHKGSVWLLWLSTDGQDFSPSFLNLSKSVDTGRTFTTLFSSLAWGDGFFDEKLAVDDQNRIYMLWDDQQVKLTRFHFSDTTERIDAEIPNDTLGFSHNTCLLVSKDYVVHCLWEGSYYDSTDILHEYVYYSRSNDTGMTFQGRLRVDTTSSANIYLDVYHYPSLGVDSLGIVYASYTKETQANDREIRIARSTDKGRSFNPPVVISGTDTAYESKLCVDSQNGVNILWNWQGGYTIAHYRSTDGGITFAPYAFPRIGFYDFIAGKDGFLYVTTLNSNYLFSFSTTNVVLSVSNDISLPNTFVLFPNYPNPFNPSTTIQYKLKDDGTVKLSVFNVLGQEVKILVNEAQQAGYKTVNFDAGNLASSVYYARLLVTDGYGKQLFIATEKLLLMK